MIAKKRFERVHSSLSRSELVALDAVVTSDGLSRSSVIRAALLDYLKRRQGYVTKPSRPRKRGNKW